MKLFWSCQIIVVMFLLEKAYFYPQTGVYVGIKNTNNDDNSKESREGIKKEWTSVDNWRVNIGNEKIWFREDVVYDGGFIAPRSGLYYVMVYLEFKTLRAGEKHMNITVTSATNKRRYYTAKFSDGKSLSHIQMNEILLVDKKDKINIFLWSSNTYRLSKYSRLFLQYISAYQNVIGFVAKPKKDSKVSKVRSQPQVLVGWTTQFDIVNGFSRTTGEYTVISEGYYLIVFKLIFVDVSDSVKVELWENESIYYDIERSVGGYQRWESLSHIAVRKCSSKTKLSLKLYSSSSISYLSKHSTFSVLYLAPLRGSSGIGFGVRHFQLKSNTRTEPNTPSYTIKNWDATGTSKMLFYNEFRVPRSGYYIISIEVYLENRVRSTPIKLQLNFRYHTVQRLFGDADSTQLSLSGIFFVSGKDNFHFSIDSPDALVMQKRTAMTVYEITYETYTNLYQLSSVRPPNTVKVPNTVKEQNMFKEPNMVKGPHTVKGPDTVKRPSESFLKLMQSEGSCEFITLSEDRLNLKITKGGIYYLVLNLFLGNSTEHNLDFTIQHRSVQESWKLLTTVYVSESSNCYLPLTLLLYPNEEIRLLKNGVADLGTELSNSYLFVQFIKDSDPGSILSTNIRQRIDLEKGFRTSYVPSNNKRYLSPVYITVEGFYLVTFNIIIKTSIKNIKRKLELNLLNSDKSIVKLGKDMFNTTVANIVYTRTIYLAADSKLDVQLTARDEHGYIVTFDIDESSYFSTLLITKEKSKYFEVDGNVRRPMSNGELLFQLTPRYPGDPKYVTYHYTLKAERSFAALLSATLIGKACSDVGGSFLQLSLRLKNTKSSWEYMTVKKFIKGGSSNDCRMIHLHVSGFVIVHRDDKIEVAPNFSNKLRFQPMEGTSLSLVVVKDERKDVRQSYFISRPIVFETPSNRDQSVMQKEGVYEVFVKLVAKQSHASRVRKDIKDTTSYQSNSTLVLFNSKDNINTSTTTSSTTSMGISATNNRGSNDNITTTVFLPSIDTTINTTSIPKVSKQNCMIELIGTPDKSANSFSVSNQLKREIAEIWTTGKKGKRIFTELQCEGQGCNQELIVIVNLNVPSNISIEVRNCNQVTSTWTVNRLSEKAGLLMQVYKENDEEICVTATSEGGFIPIKNWYSKGESYNEIGIYRATAYEIIRFYINIFTYQVNKQTRLFLVTNGLLNNAEELKMEQYSTTGFLYKFYGRRLLKRNDILQLYISCNKGDQVKLLNSSKVSIFQEDTLMGTIEDDFPVFVTHPRPPYLNVSIPSNFTCSLESNGSYHWNKIDMHTSKWTKFNESTKPFSIQGTPEESGYYFCSVNTRSGYQTQSDILTVDISDEDECLLMKNKTNGIRPCHSDGRCVNTVGSYYCECLNGYKGDGYNCTDVNECVENAGLCGNNTICTNYIGSYNCSCMAGYRINETSGFGCVDIEECDVVDRCTVEMNVSSAITYCVNYLGSYECQCVEGYEVKHSTCKDVNECHRDPKDFPCHNMATCENTIGNYTCTCDKGYFGDGKHCEDIDECKNTTLFDCPGNSTCENNNGSYRCVCNSGYKGIVSANRTLIRCVSLGCFPPPFCAGEYRISWWSRKPYIENTTHVAQAKGLFRDILYMMIKDICNNCSQLYFDTPVNGSSALETLVEKNLTDLACPLYGSQEQEKFRGFPFIPIVESPGVAFFVKEETTSGSPLVGSLAGSWPILVVTLLLASLSGVIIWFLDTVRNPSEFPHSFLEGSWEGFWWAFITMTTVGYGDKAPRSFFARAFGIIWILIGLVIISTFTATITTVLTASSLSNEAKLYGTKVGALQNSEEFRLGVKRNADVKGYTSVPKIIDALNAGIIQGALLDTYIAGEFQDQLQGYKLQEILEHVFVYGVALARDAERLEKVMRTYLEQKQSHVYSVISRVVQPLRATKASKAQDTQSGALFNSESPYFKTIVVTGSAVLGLLLFIGFLWDRCYWRRQRELEERRLNNNTDRNDEKTPIHQSWKTCDVIEYQKHAFKAEVLDLKQQICEFANIWVQKLEDMEGTHEQKLSRVQKWLGRPGGNIGGTGTNSGYPNGSSWSQKANGVRGMGSSYDEKAV